MNAQESYWTIGGGRAYDGGRFRCPAEMDALYLARFGLVPSLDLAGPLIGCDSILEVGCGRGNMLEVMRHAGLSALAGVEADPIAVAEAAQHRPHLGIVHGLAAALPFGDGAFDATYTAGLLIHVAPEDIPAVVGELVRVTRRGGVIAGLEYPAAEWMERTPGLCWRGPFFETVAALSGGTLRGWRYHPSGSLAEVYAVRLSGAHGILS